MGERSCFLLKMSCDKKRLVREMDCAKRDEKWEMVWCKLLVCSDM